MSTSTPMTYMSYVTSSFVTCSTSPKKRQHYDIHTSVYCILCWSIRNYTSHRITNAKESVDFWHLLLDISRGIRIKAPMAVTSKKWMKPPNVLCEDVRL